MTAAFGPRPTHRLTAYALLSLACVTFGLLAGKDLNWDLINYHYYQGFSVLNERFSRDFFPASTLSYATPYAYVPFYLLVSAGLDDRLISVVLAIMGSTALWAVWEIGGLLGAAVGGPRRFSLLHAYSGVSLAAICPVFFIQIGTSYIDITTAAIALFGYVFLVRFVLGGLRVQLILAAAFLGVAVALKQTNVVYALAGVVLVVAAGSRRLSNLGIYSLAGLLAGAAVTVPWGSRLYREFGNPFFPNLNSIFKSPDFDIGPMSPHYRFIPDSWLDALLRPIWMMSPEKGVYTEPHAPDARFFFLGVLIAIACVVWTIRKWKGQEPAGNQEAFRSSAVFWGLITAFVVSWCLWLAVSGNGRYFMPMALLAGPLVIACVHFVGTSRRWVGYSLSTVFAVSIALVVMGSVARTQPSQWSGRYFDVDVPRSLTERSNVVVALEVQPAAFLVPYLHPQTSYMNLAGIHVLAPGRPGWDRVERLLRRSESPRFLISAKMGDNGEMVPPSRAYLDALTARIGYRVDNEQCETITLRGLASRWSGLSSTSDGGSGFKITQVDNSLYAVCPGHPDPSLRVQYLAQSSEVDPLFDAVERRCPALFPHGAVTQGLGGTWQRTYPATDVALGYSNQKFRYLRYGHNRQRVIGTAAEIEAGQFTVDCTRKRDALLTIEDLLG